MTFPIVAAMFRHDPITINRPSGGADADGNPDPGFATVYSGRGTLGTPTAGDLAEAAARATKIDQVLALGLGIDVRDDDQVTCSRGMFEVVSVTPRRLYQRTILRKIG